ncbi:MAG: type II toxin-antitoxin system VapC family toxin [Dehalococcoidia bacterium]
MSLLLDTHVLIWALTSPRSLSALARRLLEEPANQIVVSSVSIIEVFNKHRLGKLPDGDVIVGGLDAYLAQLAATPLAVSHAHARLAGTIAHEHRNPFDRILAAQAILEGTSMLTKDPFFAQVGVTVRW